MPTFEKIKTIPSEINPGDWFLPVDVQGVDQHFRIPEALLRGASGFFYQAGHIDPQTFGTAAAEPVTDLRETLYSLARQKREKLQTKIAVVAGSNGKTTVKELLAAILARSENVFHFSPENQNTKVALASQILALSPQCQQAIFEVGARRIEDFKAPLDFLRPHIACLLNIGTAHLGEFGSLENLRRTKLSLLSTPSLRAKIVFHDDPFMYEYAMAQKGSTLSFGLHPEANYRLLEEGQDFLRFQAEDQTLSCRRVSLAPAFGLNVAAAMAIARAMEIGWTEIISGVESFRGARSRFELLTWNGKKIINDAFNASPESMLLGVRQFLQIFPSGKRVLLLGDILELGAETEALHRSIGQDLLQNDYGQSNPLLITVGDCALWIGEEALACGWPSADYLHFANAAQAFAFLKSSAWDAVYLKSSKAVGLRNLFENGP